MAKARLQDRRDQLSLYLLFALFMLLPLTVAFGHRGVAPWLLLASIPAFLRGDFWLAAFGALFDKLEPAKPFFAGFLCVVAFCGWIFLSGFWSPRGMPSLALWVLAPALIGGSVVWFALHLSPRWAFRLGAAFALSIAAGMTVLAFEGATGGALRAALPPEAPTRAKDAIALGRGVTALVPALFPAALIVAAIWNRLAATALLALGVAAAVLNDVDANAVAIAAGFVAAVAAFKIKDRIVPVLTGAAIGLLVLSPLAAFIPVETIFDAADGAPPSSLHRLAVWRETALRIPEGLPFGFGADYARIWKESAAMVAVPGAARPLSTMPTHPHNLFLQIWLELGFVGVAAMAGFFYFGARVLTAAKLRAPIIAAAAGAFAAILVSVMVEGSLWQVWRLAAMALAAMGVALAQSLHEKWSR